MKKNKTHSIGKIVENRIGSVVILVASFLLIACEAKQSTLKPPTNNNSAAISLTIDDGLNTDNKALNNADDCPQGRLSWMEDETRDGDGCRDGDEDKDKDDDGLMEIEYIEDLVELRDDLNGDGMDDGNLLSIESTEKRSCPLLVGCRGYELMRDLNFTNAASYRSGAVNPTWTTGGGWIPIGGDYDGIYSGVFEGNGKTISHLFIHNTTRENLGLFAAVNGPVSNLNLYDAFIRGANNLGILSGRSEDNQLINITAQGKVLGAGNNIGGITGEADNITLVNATLLKSTLMGSNYIGGLVGYGENLTMVSCYTAKNTVFNNRHTTEELIGRGTDASITPPYITAAGAIEGKDFVGRLIGYGDRISLILPYTALSITNETGRAGGLIGGGKRIHLELRQ